MGDPFDSQKVVDLGWRQGAVLGEELQAEAAKHAPSRVAVRTSDWFVVISHDCDVVNPSLVREPVVEVLRAQVTTGGTPDKQKVKGRHPRSLQLSLEHDGEGIVLECTVHERWWMSRQHLMAEAPATQLANEDRRLLAEWLAKRFIRAAFPSAFDQRWHPKVKKWQKLLREHSEYIQGVYLRLSTSQELEDGVPYECDVLLAVPEAKRCVEGWAAKRREMEDAVESFWSQCGGIRCGGVDVLGTGEITLADIETYQRFDADWVSYEDGTDLIPAAVDIRS